MEKEKVVYLEMRNVIADGVCLGVVRAIGLLLIVYAGLHLLLLAVMYLLRRVGGGQWECPDVVEGGPVSAGTEHGRV